MYDLPHENLTYHKIGSARGFLVLGGIMAGQGRRVPLTTRPNWPNGCPLSPVPRRDGGREGVEYLGHAPGHTCAAAGQTSASPSLDVDRLLQRRSRKVEGMLHRISTCNGMGKWDPLNETSLWLARSLVGRALHNGATSFALNPLATPIFSPANVLVAPVTSVP